MRHALVTREAPESPVVVVVALVVVIRMERVASRSAGPREAA